MKNVEDEFDNIKSKNVSEKDFEMLFDEEEKIYGKSTSGALAKFFEDIKLLFAVIKDYRTGAYMEIPWASITIIAGALIYVLSPFDLIPDFIPMMGLVDDAGIVVLCLKAVHSDLQKYKKWKASTTSTT
jgi:uncharacterized membrane protein YkvA (DUF1232 family)